MDGIHKSKLLEIKAQGGVAALVVEQIQPLQSKLEVAALAEFKAHFRSGNLTIQHALTLGAKLTAIEDLSCSLGAEINKGNRAHEELASE